MRNHSQTEEPFGAYSHATLVACDPCDMWPLWHVTLVTCDPCDMWHPWHMTLVACDPCDMWHPWHVTRRIRHATNYNASIALFKSLGLYFVASNDLSRLMLPLIWQIRPPHSLIFKKIIIITNIPTNINNFRYFMIPIYLTLEYYNTTSVAWLHQRMQYSFNPFTLLKHINWEKLNHLFIVEKPLTNWGSTSVTRPCIITTSTYSFSSFFKKIDLLLLSNTFSLSATKLPELLD